MTTAQDIRNHAEKCHAEYPQYRNHWNGWLLAEMTKTIKTRSGNVMAAKGEAVLMDPASIDPERGFVTVYSPSYYAGSGRGMDVVVPSRAVKVCG